MRTLRWALIAAFTVLVSCGGGSSSSDSEASPSPTDGGSEVAYNVGDTGPGGGIIVYVDEAGFDNSSGDDTSIGAMCLTGTCNYLEISRTDLKGQYSWDKAIVAAEAFSTLTADDWVLPSNDALGVIFASGLGGFVTDDYYWSSSGFDDNYAFLMLFANGKLGRDYSSISHYARPVRAFKGPTSSSSSEASMGSCAQGGICEVGDTGPGGGIIVYVDEAGFDNSSGDDTSIGAMCLTGTCNYLEMAPTDLEGRYSWDEAIVAAEAFSTLSADDWLLPSKDALNVIFDLAATVDGFSPDVFYWTSSEYDSSYAWYQGWTLGLQSYDGKSSPASVRPVRAFGGSTSSSSSEASPSPTDAAVEVAYNVGDTGPGGGIIVYVDEAGFDNSSGDDTSIGAMCLTGTCNYLEMAPTDLEGRYSWDEAIVAAEAFSTLSADDWLLPSKDALNVIYEFVILDDFSADYYWTSSKTADNTVWLQDFTPGGKYLYPQASSSYYVRPVRAF